MLALFRDAVAAMQGRPHHHPASWRFQANIHDYPGNEPIEEIFATSDELTEAERDAVLRHKALALGGDGKDGIWRTCSHFGYPEHFLTWHRMYLYFFERIVEEVVGQPFALPYWAYLEGPDGQRRLPASLLEETHNGGPNALWFEERNEDFVTGGITMASDVGFSTAFEERQLLKGGGRRGFNRELEVRPHNNVHGIVGTILGMGDTPMAGRDPIFWLHHANIDRLWESWRTPTADGTSSRDPLDNTDWRRHEKFAFGTPDGRRVEMSLAEAVAASGQLGVRYDKLEPAPSAMGATAEPERIADSTTLSKNAPAAPAQITKKGVPVSVDLAPAVAPPVALGFSEKPQTRYNLIVDVEADSPPGALYDVVVAVPKATGSAETEDRIVGSFSLFGESHGKEHDAGHAAAATSATWETDITDLVQEKLIDPRVPGNVTFRARYADPAVPVTVKSVRIEAR
jgi:tyrosinase